LQSHKNRSGLSKSDKRTLAIFQAKENTPEADELALLLVLVKDYEDNHTGDFLRREGRLLQKPES
jgi:hypothetical protein